jgi:hypothetical protein
MPTPSRPPPVAAAERKRGCVRRAADSSSSRSLACARQLLRGFARCWIRRYLRRGLGSRCVDTYAPMREYQLMHLWLTHCIGGKSNRRTAPPLPHLDLHVSARPRSAFALAFDLDPRRPVKHAGLRSGTPSLGEVPSVGARALWSLWAGPAFRLFSKVTRRQGGTLSSRYLNNG